MVGKTIMRRATRRDGHLEGGEGLCGKSGQLIVADQVTWCHWCTLPFDKEFGSVFFRKVDLSGKQKFLK